MTCGELIWAKVKASAIGAAIVWAMTLVALVLVLFLTGSWSEVAGQWNLLTKDLSGVEKAGMFALGAVLLLVGSWKPMIANLFLGLAGRGWVWTVGVLSISVAMMVALLIGGWVGMHPEYHGDLLACVPWALGLVAALKLLLGACVARVVIRRRVASTRRVERLMALWLVTAVALCGLLCLLVPSRLAPPPLVLACVVLALPLVRISLAPLALAWNRHR
jgi:hypothetical protein